MRSKTEIEKVRKQHASSGVSNMARMFRALSDENRLMILRVLIDKHNLCVSELAKLLSVSIPAASSHLRILEEAGILARCRQGQSVCFEVKEDKEVLKMLLKVITLYS